MSKSWKKGLVGNADGGSTSRGGAVPKVNNADEELARKLNEELNAGHLEDDRSEDHGAHTSGIPKEIQGAIDFVQGFAGDVLSTCCCSCGKRLIREFHVSEWIKKWKDGRGTRSCPSATGCTCKCGVTTCLGCGMEANVGNPKYEADYQGLKLDYCCNKGGVFIAWVVLCQYDYMELHLQERSRHNEAATRQTKEMFNRNALHKRLAGTGTGYGGDWRTSPFQYVEGHSAFVADEGFRRPGLQQALNFRQVDAETDSVTGWVLGMLIELLPRRDEPTKKVSPVMSSMIELSLLQDRVAELLRNDSLQDVHKRAQLYFTTFEFVSRLGHHSKLDYLVREERFTKKQSAGLRAIATAGGSGKGKGKGHEQDVLIVADQSAGMAPSLLSCMSKLATQSKALLSGSNSAAAGEGILALAQRVNKVCSRLIGEENAKVATVTTWKEYHQANCLVRRPDVAKNLCSLMAKLAAQVINPDKGRMSRLITETTEMMTSLPEGIFVMVDEVRPDIMKALIVGPKGTPYEGGLFEFDIVCGAHYPQKPPSVWFLTTGQGTVSFNPNLYKEGK
ncbi:MAG: hypothetical protein L6R39_005420, partial [Caloplaca ligustica]